MSRTSRRGLVRALIFALASCGMVPTTAAFADEPAGDDASAQAEAICAHLMEFVRAEVADSGVSVDELLAECKTQGEQAIAECRGDREAMVACMLESSGFSDLAACERICEGDDAEPQPATPSAASPEEVAACENMVALLTRDFPDTAGKLEVDDCVEAMAEERVECRDYKGALACVTAASSGDDIEACGAFCEPPDGHGHGHDGHAH